MEDDQTLNSPRPIDITMREHLVGTRYRAHLREWDKANDRLFDDVDGAITSGRTLIETTCKTILDDLQVAYTRSADLPKLYDLACKALDIAPGAQSDPAFKALFNATYQTIHAVAEIRNKHGDAHGKSSGTDRPSLADAELAVHFSGAIAAYMVRRFESHLSVTQRLTSDGQAILRFDKSTVWRLVDHATNAPEYSLWYEEDRGRCLYLVGDAGIYLMSNGKPGIMFDGRLEGESKMEIPLALTAEAEGCGSSAEFEAWWPIHNAIDGGNDFALPISVDEFRPPLEHATSHIVIIATSDSYAILSDAEFEKHTDPVI